METSLDIPEAQVIVNFPDDGQGYTWHHRILLARGGPQGVWVCLTPDLELMVTDFSTQAHRVLGRARNWDDDVYGVVYCFDPLQRRDLDQYVRLAKTQARILYAAPAEENVEVPMVEWLVCGPDREQIGQRVPAEIVDDGDLFCEIAGRGVAQLQSGVVFCERVASVDKEAWAKDKRTSDRDDRILGIHMRGNKRHLALSVALDLMSDQTFDDWVFKGPRVAREYLQSIAEAGGFVAFEEAWVRKSGVHSGSAQAHEHRTSTESLRLLIEMDQLDASNLLVAENLCRRQVQLELAVERSPAHPDFTGLGEVMAEPVTESGGASVPSLREWIAARQKDRANVLKCARMEKEEVAQRNKGGKGQDDSTKPAKATKAVKPKGAKGQGGGKAETPAAVTS